MCKPVWAWVWQKNGNFSCRQIYHKIHIFESLEKNRHQNAGYVLKYEGGSICSWHFEIPAFQVSTQTFVNWLISYVEQVI